MVHESGMGQFNCSFKFVYRLSCNSIGQIIMIFDALQYEFFSQNVGEEVELGELEDEGNNNTPVF